MQIDDTNIDTAIALLVRGFPSSKASFWEQGLARLRGSHAHRVGGEQCGELLYIKDEAVGVALTAVSQQTDPHTGEQRRVINLTSWYIEPEHRWKLPMLLGKMFRDPEAVYTDLTPTPEVWPLLESLGFEQLNQGICAVCVPALALSPFSSHAVLEWDAVDTSRLSPELARIFEDHRGYGCYAFAIQTEDALVPLLIKPCKIKGLPTTQVIYCNDDRVLLQALGGVSRKLLRRGHLSLLVDIPLDAAQRLPTLSVPIKSRRRRFIKNGRQDNRTDYTYSELVFFDL